MRSSKLQWSVALLAALAACGGSGGFKTAPHTAPVQVANLGGPLLTSVQLVTITYANDPLRSTDEAFDAWAVTSDWHGAVGGEYGLDGGTNANVELTEDAPTSLDDTTIDAQLTSWIGDGTLPKPTSQTLYMLYLPASTAVTVDSQFVISCTLAGGYHSESLSSQPPFPYAVIPTCPSATTGTVASEVQGVASHELLEASTDPLPSSAPAFQLPASSAWNLGTGSAGGELADLCFPLSETDGDFTVSLGWSNAAAAAGGDPCVPASPTAPYFSVSPEPASLALAPGASTEVVLLGWATGTLSAPWTIGTELLYGAQGTTPFAPTLALSETTLENDGDAELKVTVPAGTPAGSAITIVVYSQATSALGPGEAPSFANHESYWPIELTVE